MLAYSKSGSNGIVKQSLLIITSVREEEVIAKAKEIGKELHLITENFHYSNGWITN